MNYKAIDWTIDFRKHPDKYHIGRGEQGVLLVKPYKSEILPYWKFATPDKAKTSADKILAMFYEYKKQNDFVGMDMARKFLQMASRALGAMPITKVVKSMTGRYLTIKRVRAVRMAGKNYQKLKKTLSRPNLHGYFISDTKKLRMI